MQKNFREHFGKFTEMIRNDIHFGFARYYNQIIIKVLVVNVV